MNLSGSSSPELPTPCTRTAPLPLAIGLALVGMAAAFGVKYQCIAHGWTDNFQYTHLCYNDMQPLFGLRGIQDGLLPYRDTAFEYPVLTGLFMDLAGRVLRGLAGLGVLARDSNADYFVVSAAMLAPFSLITTLVLRPRVTAGRLALWAVGVPTVLYTFHNWDVLAVAAAVWGLAVYERERHGKAGSALAVGASAKLFPAFLAPGMVLGRWADGDRRGSLRLIVGFALVYTVINLPWVLISGGTPALVQSDLPGVEVRPAGTNGWLHVWLFHAARYPDYSTVWYWIGERAPRLREDPWLTGSFTEFVGLASFGLFTAATCGMLLRGWLRRREPQGYPVVAVGFGVVVGFLLTSKVYSPQFSLWVVPLLAMLDIRYRWVFAYFAAEAAVFISGFRWFTVMSEPDPAWRRVLEVAVWSRAALLVLLLWQAMTAVRLFPMPSPKNPDLPRV